MRSEISLFHAQGRRTFNRRVVFVYEVTLDELDCETTLSDTTAAHNDELVLSEKLKLPNGQLGRNMV